MSKTDAAGVLIVTCPLCLKKMRSEYVPEHKIYIFHCLIDGVKIAAMDPMVGKWDKFQHEGGEIPCMRCNANMRVFATSVGYVKAKCYKKGCGASMASGTPEEDFRPHSILQKPPGNA